MVNKKKFFIVNLSILLFTGVLFFLTRQVPFKAYSFLMNILLFLIFIFGCTHIIKKISYNGYIKKSTFVCLGMLILLIFYAILIGNDPTLILRFSIILTLIILAYFIKPNLKFVKIFLFFEIVQSIFVIGLQIILVSSYDFESYMPIRMFFLENGFGDVYTTGSNWWKIQPLGNALLPFAYFISFLIYTGKFRFFICSLFLIAILCAGNFAFLMGIIVFKALYFVFIKKWDVVNILTYLSTIIIIFLFSGKYLFNSFLAVIENKSLSSNQIRIDQIKILSNNISENTISIFFGSGLGNLLNYSTIWRDYSNSIYYEMQTFYIINQVGFVFFSLYLLLNFLLSIYTIKLRSLLVVYVSYLVYSFFNPYIFDTNHIVVIILLVSSKKLINAKSIFNNSYIQSRYS